ncbi:T9SS type A sorting domain-containing protein [Flavobacterium sp.]|uniref:T9SS type A sorting domain-containing protein n=1 Tax=Flavobacterium sp. TaxID=239 RepID=UPI0040344768
MKKSLLFASIAFSISASAQFVVWEDDFNDGNISDWTVLDLNADGQSWQANKDIQINDAGQPDITIGQRSVLAAYNIDMITGSPLGNGGAYPFDHEWVKSPAIDLSLYTGETSLIINAQKSIYDGPDNLYVYVSTSPETASFELLSEVYLNRVSMTDPEFADHTVDLTDYVGEEQVYIAFVTINNFFVGYEIDNVKIVASGIAGVKGHNRDTIAIEQNPVAETLKLKFTEASVAAGPLTLQIFDLSGKIVKETVYSEEGIAVSELAGGMYFVAIDNGAATERLKFIKK